MQRLWKENENLSYHTIYLLGAGRVWNSMKENGKSSKGIWDTMMMVFTANEMLFAGIDPKTIRFKRAGCFDVGLECGGWGRIVLELRVEDKP